MTYNFLSFKENGQKFTQAIYKHKTVSNLFKNAKSFQAKSNELMTKAFAIVN